MADRRIPLEALARLAPEMVDLLVRGDEMEANRVLGAVPCPGQHSVRRDPYPPELTGEGWLPDHFDQRTIDLLSDPRNHIRCADCGAWL